MKNLWRVFLGIIIALASICLILGILSLSLAEGNVTTTLTPTLTLISTYSPTLQPSKPSTDSPTFSPTSSPNSISTTPATLTPTLTSTWTPSLSPSPNSCPSPQGWTSYVVQSGDTFEKIAAHYRISSTVLQQANCLLPTGLVLGMVIHVPPVSTVPTQIPVPCGPPYTWISYMVQPGDTLYHLSQSFGSAVDELQRANCMGNSTLLHTGQIIYVPPWASLIPSSTVPSMFTSTPIPTNTPVPSLPSDTPTEASLGTLTDTPTDTPVPAASDTPPASDTPSASNTPVDIPTEILTPTNSW